MKPEEILGYAKRRFVGDLQMTEEQFYGVMGSVMGESGRGLDSRAHNPNDPDGGAHGMFQHVGSRWRGLKAYAESAGRDPYDPRTQIDYVADVELPNGESKALYAVKNAKDRQEAAEAWTRTFERPAANAYHLDRRYANADHVATLDGKEALGYSEGSNFSSMGDNSMGLFDELATTLAPTGGGKLSLDGPSTPMQKLLVLGGTMEDPEIGSKLLHSIVGGGGKPPADLSILDSIGLIAGAYLGGMPGAAAMYGLSDVVGDMFDPKGDERRAERGRIRREAQAERKAANGGTAGTDTTTADSANQGNVVDPGALVDETGSVTGAILSTDDSATTKSADKKLLTEPGGQLGSVDVLGALGKLFGQGTPTGTTGSVGSPADNGGGFMAGLAKLFGG